MTLQQFGPELAHDLLPDLRALAESRMLGEYAVMEHLGVEFNEDTGEDEQSYALLFTTKGRVKVIGAYGVDQEVGGRTATEIVREFHIPVDSPAVPPKAVAFCVVIDEASDDPALLGAGLVIEPMVGSQTTARRMKVTEILS